LGVAKKGTTVSKQVTTMPLHCKTW